MPEFSSTFNPARWVHLHTGPRIGVRRSERGQINQKPRLGIWLTHHADLGAEVFAGNRQLRHSGIRVCGK